MQTKQKILKRLNRWLRENINDHLQVIHQGKENGQCSARERRRILPHRQTEELLQLITAHLLAPDFEDRYPDYPSFKRATQVIAENSRSASAMDAVFHLGGRSRTNFTQTVLEGLELLDADGNIRPYDSKYAEKFLKALTKSLKIRY